MSVWPPLALFLKPQSPAERLAAQQRDHEKQQRALEMSSDTEVQGAYGYVRCTRQGCLVRCFGARNNQTHKNSTHTYTCTLTRCKPACNRCGKGTHLLVPITSSWHSKWPPLAYTLQEQSVLSDSSPQPVTSRTKPCKEESCEGSLS